MYKKTDPNNQKPGLSSICPALRLLEQHGYKPEFMCFTVNGKKVWGLGIYQNDELGEPHQCCGVLKSNHCEAIMESLRELGFGQVIERLHSECVSEVQKAERFEELFEKTQRMIHTTQPIESPTHQKY